MLKDLDLDSVEMLPFNDDLETGIKYQAPPLPNWAGEVEDGMKVYKGNCHCGAVTYAVKTEPLEKLKIMNCNCSLCSRVSALRPRMFHSLTSLF